MYGNKRDDGVSYFRRVSRQNRLALAISEDVVITAAGFWTPESFEEAKRRHWRHVHWAVFIEDTFAGSDPKARKLLEAFIFDRDSRRWLQIRVLLPHTSIHLFSLRREQLQISTEDTIAVANEFCSVVQRCLEFIESFMNFLMQQYVTTTKARLKVSTKMKIWSTLRHVFRYKFVFAGAFHLDGKPIPLDGLTSPLRHRSTGFTIEHGGDTRASAQEATLLR